MNWREEQDIPVRTLRERTSERLKASARFRPVSFYLLLGMIAVLLFGGRFVYIRDDPRQFALFLTLYFLFFFVVIFRATLDAFDIFREHFRRHEGLFRDTFASDDFAERLGAQVADKEKNGV